MKTQGVIHHIHKRKRKKEYPSKDKRIEFLDKIILVISFVAPLTAVPQIFDIWINKNVAGISVLTWSLFTILAIPMIVYGIVHKENPITIMYILWAIIDFLVVLGVLLYA